MPPCAAPSSHCGGWRADRPEGRKAADSVEQRFDNFQENFWGVRLGGLAWPVWLLVLAGWRTTLLARGSPSRPRDDRTGTPWLRIKTLSVTSPASDTAEADTPGGTAEFATPWCTDHQWPSAARPLKAQRPGAHQYERADS
jgi:hypothetical protein